MPFQITANMKSGQRHKIQSTDKWAVFFSHQTLCGVSKEPHLPRNTVFYHHNNNNGGNIAHSVPLQKSCHLNSCFLHRGFVQRTRWCIPAAPSPPGTVWQQLPIPSLLRNPGWGHAKQRPVQLREKHRSRRREGRLEVADEHVVFYRKRAAGAHRNITR